MAGVEEGEDAEVRAMFETNFFGLLNMTRAVLPSMQPQPLNEARIWEAFEDEEMTIWHELAFTPKG